MAQKQDVTLLELKSYLEMTSVANININYS